MWVLFERLMMEMAERGAYLEWVKRLGVDILMSDWEMKAGKLGRRMMEIGNLLR